ncbi:MAG: D-tyrosyl-tRNA(Tyr) deacylase [Lachnospiraceae bacterium]|nr:D-tyrosyl-tRNA(Tyr) deacylase [Lachnospiraceae bacterium]
MKLIIQRVARAAVRVDGEVVGSVEKGFLVLLGVTHSDSEAQADKLVKKLLGLRIFPDENGKINLSLRDVGGALLVVSQFTLYADCHKGYRPSFVDAAAPEKANALYEYFVQKCREGGFAVGTGVFGAKMEVELINDGPFTIVLEETA